MMFLFKFRRRKIECINLKSKQRNREISSKK